MIVGRQIRVPDGWGPDPKARGPKAKRPQVRTYVTETVLACAFSPEGEGSAPAFMLLTCDSTGMLHERVAEECFLL